MIKLRKGFEIFLIISAVLLVFLECAARVYQCAIRHRSIEDIIFHPCYRDYFLLGRSFKPNTGGEWQRIPDLEINSMGFRGGEIDFKKEKGALRIAFLGASTTHAGNYPEILRDRLIADDRFKNAKIEVINAAVPGWGSTQSLIQFLIRVVYLDPDMVIVYHGINDAERGTEDYHWLKHMKEVDYKRYSGFFRRHSVLYNFVSNQIERAIYRISYLMWKLNPKRDKNYGKITASTQVYRMNLDHIAAAAKARGIKAVFVTMPLNFDANRPFEENAGRAGYPYRDFEELAAKVDKYNEETRTASREDGAVLVDAAASDMSRHPEYFVDLCHFSDEGARFFAGLVMDKIAQPLAFKIKQ